MACRFAKMFGSPNEGVHAHRFANIAVVDVVATIILGAIVAFFTKWSFWTILFCLFLLGIVAHRVFCVRTTIDRLLFTR